MTWYVFSFTVCLCTFLLLLFVTHCKLKFQSLQIRDLFEVDLTITRNLLKIIKFFLTKELAEKFTAVRSARGNQSEERQQRFALTNLYRTICGMYQISLKSTSQLADLLIKFLFTEIIKYERRKKSMETTDKGLLTCISEVFCNVKHQWK